MAPIRLLLEQSLNACHLVFQRLVPIGADVDLHVGEDAIAPHGMQRPMTGHVGSMGAIQAQRVVDKGVSLEM